MRQIMLALTAALSSACVSNYSITKERAAYDFRCSEDSISVRNVSGSTFEASGCGRVALYTCTAGSGLSGPACIAEQQDPYYTSPTFPTRSPVKQGTERAACYPNNTCNDGLMCLSDLCVKPPARGEPASPPSQDRSTRPNPSGPITLELGTLDSAIKAEQVARNWLGQPVVIQMKDGARIPGKLLSIRNLRAFLSGGQDVDMLDAQAIELGSAL